MSDYLDGIDILGISWGEIGDVARAAFPIVHQAGAGVLSAFGAGAIVDPIEALERKGGLLPPKAVVAVVNAPDFALVTYTDKRKPDILVGVAQLQITGGKKFGGNGYAGGGIASARFSFGWDVPTQVQVTLADKRTFVLAGIQQLIVGGGAEGTQTVLGRDLDWRWIFLDPAGELYRSQTDVGPSDRYTGFANPGDFYQKSRQESARERAKLEERTKSGTANISQLRKLRDEQIKNYLTPSSAFGTASPFATSVFDTWTPTPTPTPTPSPPATGNTPPAKEEKGIMSSILDILGLAKSDTGGGKGGSPPPGRRGGGGPTRTPPPAEKGGIVVRQTPGGRQFTSFKVNRDARYNPQKALEAARIAAKRAVDTGNKLKSHLASGKIKGVNRGKPNVLGAVGKGTVRPKPRFSKAQLDRMAQSLTAEGKKLGTHADKYSTQLVAQKNALKAGVAQGRRATKLLGLDSVLGYAFGQHDDGVFDVLGAEIAYAAATRELVGAPTDPDPLNPGHLIDGSPDPAAGGGSGGSGGTTDTGTGSGSGTTDTSTTDTGGGGKDSWTSQVPGPDTNYGAGPMPTRESAQPQEGWDYMADPFPNGDDPTFYSFEKWDELPMKAVVYDGQIPSGHMDLGSYSVFFGQVPGGGEPKGGRNSGFSVHGDGKWWLELKGPGGGYTGNHNYDTVSRPNGAMQFESQKNGWGPLIGNPQHYEPGSDSWQPGNMFKGLRFSPTGPDGPFWWWYWDMAPQSAKQKQLESFYQDALTTWKAAVTAGKTDYVQAVMQDSLDAADARKDAKEQGRIDAEIERRKKLADQQQAEFEQKQLQTETGLDTTYAQQQQQLAQQQAEFQAKMQQLQLQYMQQHPEMAFPAYGGGGGEGGEGGGYITEEGEAYVPASDEGVDWGDSDDSGGEGF